MHRVAYGMGMSIFLIEYPNYLARYPREPQMPLRDQIHRDSLAFYDFLVSNGINDNEIVIIGRSLGTSFASFIGN